MALAYPRMILRTGITLINLQFLSQDHGRRPGAPLAELLRAIPDNFYKKE